MKAFLYDDITPGMSEKEASREGSVMLDEDCLRDNIFTIPAKVRWSRTYFVGPEDNEDPCDMTYDDALRAKGIPALQDVIGGSTVIGHSAVEINSLEGMWKVITYFDNDPPVPQDFIYYWDDETIEKVLHRDPVTGHPIVNAVGEPLHITAPVTIQVLNIERAERQLPNGISGIQMPTKSKQLLYCNRMNSVAYSGFPPTTALMHSIRDAPLYRDGLVIRKVNYVIKFDLSTNFDGDRIGWRVELLNHGSKYTDVTTGDLATFTDQLKNPTTGNLDLTGLPLDQQDPPVWLLFNRFPYADLGFLDIEIP